ncbi:hypothetical protein [Natronoflexus pectinivorans]|nr:hypothetical protein [Natronoflexus pectinivorans]
MKANSISTLLLSVVFFITLFSCSKDDNGTNEVTLKVFSNTADVPIILMGGFPKEQLTIKDYYEECWHTDWGQTYVKARCDDETVLITIEVYINGKLKERGVGNGFLRVDFNIK